MGPRPTRPKLDAGRDSIGLLKNDNFLVALEAKPLENGYSSYEFRSYYWHWTFVKFLAAKRQLVPGVCLWPEHFR